MVSDTVTVSREEYDTLRAVEEAAWGMMIDARHGVTVRDYPNLLHLLRVLYDIREEQNKKESA